MRKYRTLQGDMWDMIAYRNYPEQGKERMMSILIEANEEYAEVVKFPAGIILNIPESSAVLNETLPPWKR